MRPPNRTTSCTFLQEIQKPAHPFTALEMQATHLLGGTQPPLAKLLKERSITQQLAVALFGGLSFSFFHAFRGRLRLSGPVGVLLQNVECTVSQQKPATHSSSLRPATISGRSGKKRRRPGLGHQAVNLSARRSAPRLPDESGI